MAVDKNTISSELQVLYNAAKTSEMSEQDFADGMATIIKNAILSATVTGSASGVMSGSSIATVTGSLS
jgi:hypothetical protein